ncbi:LOW QUALITY PROTEIN: hypothetical protein Cgig2_021703 [Carnegiea gigantea]|uniref:Uncharacterized protein n=1 Tax=Carnegiea gigantea TaxID=171969 RepID=A0A9Q1KT62_9CARY|nr:LOW QUALITY PROTEIN: hypothetical protein Cgig2_021703 [Carnegiea gigantea]
MSSLKSTWRTNFSFLISWVVVSLLTSSRAPRFSPEAAPKYLKLPKSTQLKCTSCTSQKLCVAIELPMRLNRESNLAGKKLAERTIRDAFGSCVEQGANRVIISPFFFFPGRHWHQVMFFLTVYQPHPPRSGIGLLLGKGEGLRPWDSFWYRPDLLVNAWKGAATAKEHLGIPYLITAPLGLHELRVGADYSPVRKKVLPWKFGGANKQCSLGYVSKEKVKKESRRKKSLRR